MIKFSASSRNCLTLFSQLQPAPEERSWGRRITAWDSQEKKERKVCLLSFPMLNIGYHISRKTASDLAGPGRKRVKDTFMQPWVPSSPFCSGLRGPVVSCKNTMPLGTGVAEIIPVPPDGNFSSLEYSGSAFRKQHHAVRTKREKRWLKPMEQHGTRAWTHPM